ncbi:hypothetical protein SSIN_0327 [Streptococcus sinensis]|uniref:Uncharacterized protein n=1 Tax=Streptococcus sinensis TaxID=176090 RepID=A0A0A0DIK2_9STRE|nr:hypothetical protein SSIN_0327 [Streptococcus sinensis]
MTSSQFFSQRKTRKPPAELVADSINKKRLRKNCPSLYLVVEFYSIFKRR